MDRHNEALPCFARAIQLDPLCDGARAGRVVAAFPRSDQRALDHFAWPPNGAEQRRIPGNSGFALYRTGKLQEAAQILRRAVTMPPVEVPAPARSAKCCGISRSTRRPCRCRQAERMAPRHARPHIVENCYQVLARFVEAAAAYRRVMESTRATSTRGAISP
jgi:tetratricopeptide (TPR) repeat protein